MRKKIFILLFTIALISGGIFILHKNTDTFFTGFKAGEDNTGNYKMSSREGYSMHHMQQMTVTSEKEFIQLMIPHHKEAIDTATEVLERGGTTNEIINLMNSIIDNQTAEIESMKAWYENWYGVTYQNTEVYEPMMRDLTSLSGTELDKAFLEDMIIHHMGAIMMARGVQPYIKNTETSELTKNIITSQSQEMILMRGILQKL